MSSRLPWLRTDDFRGYSEKRTSSDMQRRRVDFLSYAETTFADKQRQLPRIHRDGFLGYSEPTTSSDTETTSADTQRRIPPDAG